MNLEDLKKFEEENNFTSGTRMTKQQSILAENKELLIQCKYDLKWNNKQILTLLEKNDIKEIKDHHLKTFFKNNKKEDIQEDKEQK